MYIDIRSIIFQSGSSFIVFIKIETKIKQLHCIDIDLTCAVLEKKTHMIFNFGVSSGLHKQLHDLVPVETYCIVQGRIPFL